MRKDWKKVNTIRKDWSKCKHGRSALFCVDCNYATAFNDKSTINQAEEAHDKRTAKSDAEKYRAIVEETQKRLASIK